MKERIPDYNFENQEVQSSIEALLPRYYELHPLLRYEAEQVYDIDGHEVAWMSYTTTRDDEKPLTGHAFKCECDFTEGVGWREHDEYGVVTMNDFEEECSARGEVVIMRKDQLRAEYAEKFAGVQADEKLFLRSVMMDLIEKDQAGEFIGETHNGAHFWGGHYYVQTAVDIAGIGEGQESAESWRDVWSVLDRMQVDKQIQLNGMVVQEYYEPPAAQWAEYGRYEYEGYIGVIHLPAHRHMPQEWQITILDRLGKELATHLRGPALLHEPVFGVDAEDADLVEQYVVDSINQIINDPMSQA